MSGDQPLELVPRTTYRLYKEGARVTIVALEDAMQEPVYDRRNVVSKVFYTREGAEVALFGYRMLQGETLSLEERMTLVHLLLR